MVVSKSSIGIGSNSILAGGGLSFAIEEVDIENLIKETLSLGKYLNNRALVNELARGGGKEFEFLRTLGLDLNHRPPLGYTVNLENMRENIGGRILVKKLVQEASKYEKIHFLPHFFVDKILHREDQVSGYSGLIKRVDHALSFRNQCFGYRGGGGIYKRNDNFKRILGDGYTLALEMGLPLIDMEFVQFYPFGMAEPGVPQSMIYLPWQMRPS